MSVTRDVLAGPHGVDLHAPLARANPSAKLTVASVLSLALVLTTDVVTAGVALVLVLLALPFTGLGPAALWRRARVLVIAAVPTGIFTAVLGVDSGTVLVPLGPLSVSTGSALAGFAIVLRIFAIGLPGVVLLSTTDPTDLADSLSQDLRLPARFVLSALAAMRLFGVLAEEWTALGQARRARGLGGDGGLSALRVGVGQLFALLVLAIRRATVLATAMEARGFGVGSRRTWARPSRFTGRDWLLVAGAVSVAAAATAAGLLAGTWELVLLS